MSHVRAFLKRCVVLGLAATASLLPHSPVWPAWAGTPDIRVRLLADVAEDRSAQAVLVDDALALLSARAATDGDARAALDLLSRDKVPEALARIEAAARGVAPANDRAASQLWRIAGFVAGPTDAARSAAAFEAALRLQPDDEAARFGLGIAQSRLGRRPEARATFAAVLAATADEPVFFYQYWARLRAADLALLARDREADTVAATLEGLRGRLAAEIAKDPAKAAWMRDLASSLHILGARYTSHGDAAAALATQRDALVVIERLVARDASDPHLQRDLAVSREILAEALKRSGDKIGALAGYEGALLVFNALVVADPTDVILRKDVARADEAAADLMVETARFKEAQKLLVESVGTADFLGRVYKEGGSEWAEDLVRREEKLGDLLQNGGNDVPGAIRVFNGMRSVAAWLTRNDPAWRPWQLQLATAYRKLGIARDLGGDHKAANEAYEHALGVGMKLVADDPADMAGQSALAIVYEALGARNRAGGAKEAAVASFEAALAIRVLAAAKTPGDTGAQHTLALAHEHVADAEGDRGDDAAALRSFRSAAAIYDALLAAEPNDPERLRDAGIAHNEVGCAALKRGDKAAAIADFRHRHALFDRAAALRPDDADAQQEFVISYDQLLMTMRDAGRGAEAAAFYAANRARMTGVAQRHPALGAALASIATEAEGPAAPPSP